MTRTDGLGNVSDLPIAVSYLVTNMLRLRALAIAGLASEAAYFYAAGSGSLWMAIGRSLAFLLINAVQLTRLVRELRFTRMSEDEQVLDEASSAPPSMPSFRRPMSAGQWRSVAPGEVLTSRLAPVTHLRMLTRGTASVEVDGRRVAAAHSGGIAGEVSLLRDDVARATNRHSGDPSVRDRHGVAEGTSGQSRRPAGAAASRQGQRAHRQDRRVERRRGGSAGVSRRYAAGSG
ncbi:MAG TPA: hypothetical protein PL196_03310 [Burkholderiaceae bacterium]|nr:hypothetical protein [Burkholderiaceae bacterium]